MATDDVLGRSIARTRPFHLPDRLLANGMFIRLEAALRGGFCYCSYCPLLVKGVDGGSKVLLLRVEAMLNTRFSMKMARDYCTMHSY